MDGLGDGRRGADIFESMDAGVAGGLRGGLGDGRVSGRVPRRIPWCHCKTSRLRVAVRVQSGRGQCAERVQCWRPHSGPPRPKLRVLRPEIMATQAGDVHPRASEDCRWPAAGYYCSLDVVGCRRPGPCHADGCTSGVVVEVGMMTRHGGLGMGTWSATRLVVVLRKLALKHGLLEAIH